MDTNDYSAPVVLRKAMCTLCRGNDGEQKTDPETGEPYVVTVLHALPLEPRSKGSREQWIAQPICVRCKSTLEAQATARKETIKFYDLERTLREVARRNQELERQAVYSAIIIHRYGRYPYHRQNNDDDSGDSTAPPKGSS